MKGVLSTICLIFFGTQNKWQIRHGHLVFSKRNCLVLLCLFVFVLIIKKKLTTLCTKPITLEKQIRSFPTHKVASGHRGSLRIDSFSNVPYLNCRYFPMGYSTVWLSLTLTLFVCVLCFQFLMTKSMATWECNCFSGQRQASAHLYYHHAIHKLVMLCTINKWFCSFIHIRSVWRVYVENLFDAFHWPNGTRCGHIAKKKICL